MRFKSSELVLTGQLHNLSESLRKLLAEANPPVPNVRHQCFSGKRSGP
jgi:hypothetical protein